MCGEWENSRLSTGKWIYPNGLYFEGAFQNNKPQGKGTWFFKNGNCLEGTFEQKPKVKGEDEAASDEEVNENGDAIEKKVKFDLVWNTTTNIAASAHQVNSVEQ